jgi:hypothetical protein
MLDDLFTSLCNCRYEFVAGLQDEGESREKLLNAFICKFIAMHVMMFVYRLYEICALACLSCFKLMSRCGMANRPGLLCYVVALSR